MRMHCNILIKRGRESSKYVQTAASQCCIISTLYNAVVNFMPADLQKKAREDKQMH